jgi:hypothetical protein
MPLSLFPSSRPDRAEPAAAGDGPEPRAKGSPARRRGATALEYVFVASLIIVVAFSAINYFGQKTTESLNQTSNAIDKAEK